jgi:two-component sensor histidine kinase
MRPLLYIDDDEGLCRLVKRDLDRNGYTVDYALDGTAGLERASSSGYDAVILDHHMPGRDGLAILDELRKLPDPPPVIYVTGEAEGRIAVAALKAGAAEYVIKEANGEFLALLRAAVANAIEARDIRRARAAAEEELRASRDRFEALAAERAVLIHEINHRVANSLQLVNAFLRLQAGATEDGPAKAALAGAMARVNAIGHVHRQLYAENDVREIDLGRYLEGLVSDLQQAVGRDAAASLRLSAEPVPTSTDRAISIGIMVTELALNALKYAYPEGQVGEIRILCRSGTDGGTELVVEDDGVGMDTAAPAQGDGLGGRIVAMMAAKLQAEIALDPAHRGVRTVIRLPRG